MKRYKIFGPPGTGKTTYLLQQLTHELEVVPPQEIAFVSFTKKGTYEGVSRAMEQFDLKPSQLPFFKTIHALCFAAAGAKKKDMVQRQHYKLLSDTLGMRFLGYYTYELQHNDDQYLFAEQLERNNPQAAEVMLRDMNDKVFRWVKGNYKKLKEQRRLYDFTDLLDLYLLHGEPLPVKVAIIDEAQDLTPLQWQVVEKMFCNCERIYVAGDDDQAIYNWAGADVDKFLHLPGDVTVLSKSYRLPKMIHTYATDISAQIAVRQEKQFSDNGSEGQLNVTTSWDTIDLNPNESTLILSRNNCFLNNARDSIRSKGVVYEHKGVCPLDPKVFRAIIRYEQCRRGEVDKKLVSLYGMFFKTLDKDVPWYEVLNADAEDIAYYRMLIGNKTDLNKPTVALETIHSSKGGEADHVVLLMDVTVRVHENCTMNNDNELRCLYVGATRAKKKLTIKLSDSSHSFPMMPCVEQLIQRSVS